MARVTVNPTHVALAAMAAHAESITTLRNALNDVRAYLQSDKFRDDPTVQVADVLARLASVEQDVETQHETTLGALTACECGHGPTKHEQMAHGSAWCNACDGSAINHVFKSHDLRPAHRTTSSPAAIYYDAIQVGLIA